MTIRQLDWVCERCHNPTNCLALVSGQKLCRRCQLQATGELEKRTTIPEGCEMRFLFGWWYWHKRRKAVMRLAERVELLPERECLITA